jgi:hypothetical protein
MYSIEISKVAECIRGIVFFKSADGINNVIDIAENQDPDIMLDYLFDTYPIAAVKMPDGTLDAGDELSVREVADIMCLEQK